MNYYKACSDSLTADAKQAGFFNNTSDCGTFKEQSLAGFLKTHLPIRCEVLIGGQIFDSDGNVSDQIDILVTGDYALQFRNSTNIFTKAFNCVEGCLAAISVKSYLREDTLINAIDNLITVPSFPVDVQKSMWVSRLDEILKQLPRKIIFAYNGLKAETIMEHLNNYYSKNSIPIEKRPDLIIVNGSYHLFKVVVPTLSDNLGHTFNYGDMVLQQFGKYDGASALAAMLSMIQIASSISPHIIVNFDHYRIMIDEYCQESILGNIPDGK